MPVTELALCRLKHHDGANRPSTVSTSAATSSPPPSLASNATGSTIPDSVLADFRAAAHAQASFSGFPVNIVQCIEDPLLLYLIGGWASMLRHTEDWIPSRENQDLMAKLTESVDVLWMFHIDVHPDAVADMLRGGSRDDAVSRKRDVLAIGRHFVCRDAREAFSKSYLDHVDALEAFLGDGDRAVGVLRMQRGWVLDYGVMLGRDPGREEACETTREGGGGEHIDEMVLFTAWPSVDRHQQFATTEDFQRYGQIRQFMIGAEVKHAKVVFEERKI